MKIFLAQQNYHVGNFESNKAKIIEAIQQAKEKGGDLVVFSELSVCGYPPRDFLYFNDFINKCLQVIDDIKRHTKGIGVIVGSPSRNPHIEGKDLYNSAFFLADGEVKKVVHKTCLPTYDVFDEDRYFEPATTWDILEFKNKKIALTICEDIWNLGDNPLYVNCPMDELIGQQPDFMINISASPFDYTHDEDRQAAVKANVDKYKIPMFYCNGVGSQTEVVFDGTSLVFDKDANLCAKMSSFKEELRGFMLNDDGTVGTEIITRGNELPNVLLNPTLLDEKLHIAMIYEALILGIRDYFKKMGFKKSNPWQQRRHRQCRNPCACLQSPGC